MHINKMFTLCYIINMVSDADRQITRISYDRQNLPRRTDYLDGSHVDYTYDADGGKLRVDYYLSPYIMVPGDEFGIAVDSTQLVHTWREYVGNSVYENDTLRMVLIDGGYITFDGASRQPLYHYYAKDYLSNNRAVTDEAGRIEEINHYYPFGGLMGDSHNTATQPYKYIGKELDRTHGLDWYDHGARHYDPVTGRWNVADAMAEKYYSLSPYVSCGDDPVDAVDIDGYICIFINGFAILPQGRKYWQTSSGDFVAKVQSHFHDYAQPLFYDGSIGGLPRLFAPNKIPYEDNSNLNLNLRYNAGYDNGQSVAGKIIKQLKRDKIGRIIEPVRIISHSMGGAYAKGFAQALIEYVKKHSKITDGLKIAEYDFAPYQSKHQEAVYGVDTYQYSHKYDIVAGDAKISGAHFMNTSDKASKGHYLEDYIDYILQLPQGNYIFENGNVVKEK